MKASNTERRSLVREWFIPALIAATCIRVWLIPGGEVLPRAQAQIPDSGLQRKQILQLIAAERRREHTGQQPEPDTVPRFHRSQHRSALRTA